jgi:hypothetical protein
MADMAKLEAALDAVAPPIYRTTFDEIRDYYEDKFSSRDWIGQMAQAMTDSPTRNGPKYRAARRNIERWISGRNPSAKSQKKLEELGRNLPPIGRKVPPGFTIRVKGKFNPSPKRKAKGEKERDRTIEVSFTGSDAVDFADNPSYEEFFERFGVDGEAFADMLDDSAQVSAY